MRIFALQTNLFPDRGTVDAALDALAAAGHEIARMDAPGKAAPDADWDRVVEGVMAADLAVTV